MRGRRNLMLAALLFAMLPFSAYSQTAIGPPCADRTKIVEVLRKKFGEQLIAYGLLDTGKMLEIHAAADGTWTLIVTDANGTSCLVASGSHWDTAKPPSAGI